jgi:hypothetical protein
MVTLASVDRCWSCWSTDTKTLSSTNELLYKFITLFMYTLEIVYIRMQVHNGVFCPLLMSDYRVSWSYTVGKTACFSNRSFITKSLTNSHPKRLRWSRGSVLDFGTQVRGFKPSRSRRMSQSHVADLQHVKRTLKVALTRSFQAKFTGHFSPQ